MKSSSLNTKLTELNIKILFTDFFDTIVHRRVHPNYTQRVWAKFLIKEFGLRENIDSLYFIRRESSIFLKKSLNCSEIEVPYHMLKEEVFNRLQNNLVLNPDQRESFLNIFEQADLKAEMMVQYLNQEVVESIKNFKQQGGKVYLISDFYASTSLFDKMLKAHGVRHLFDGIYSSAASQKSKKNATIYNHIIKQLKLDPAEVLMWGDNKTSDVENAQKAGLNSYLLPHQHFLIRNKLMGLGNDSKSLKKAINRTLKQCRKSAFPPLSQYVIMLFFFTERLHAAARRFNIQDLIFLSREGKILKDLFDIYQERFSLSEESKINTHYFKISRQASLQITLKPLAEESFAYLREYFSSLSLNEFYNFFDFSVEDRKRLTSFYKFDHDQVHDAFFDSQEFNSLINTGPFPEIYEAHCKYQKTAFNCYLDSLDLQSKPKGLHLVDVGWGGTMQEAIFKYFNEEIPVYGYYLGLKKTYNITENTKRFGLLFSVQPYEVYSDHILMANTQFYEQLLTANHGGTKGYSMESGAVLEDQKEEEITFFTNNIRPWQENLVKLFKDMLEDYGPLCYNYDLVQRELTRVALKTGLLLDSQTLGFINTLNENFKQNIGVEQTGVVYRPSDAGSRWNLIKRALIQPESVFRYLVKIKPLLYSRNTLSLLIPQTPVYLYYKLNRYIRERWLKRRFFLQFNYFK